MKTVKNLVGFLEPDQEVVVYSATAATKRWQGNAGEIPQEYLPMTVSRTLICGVCETWAYVAIELP